MSTRRRVLGGVIAAATVATAGISTNAQNAAKTFVLVHGAFAGGWMWRRVADILERRGHKVFTPTLTGLGERSHLLDASVNLSTHITDVANVIKWERLESVILVGHSYGGMVIAGVAEKAEHAISSIVFVDAFVPQTGQSALDVSGPGDFANLIRTTQQKNEFAVAPFSAAALGLTGADLMWVDSLTSPLPIATQIEKLPLTGAYDRIPRKAYVRAAGNADPTPERFFRTYESASGWRAYQVPCGHAVMVEMPERLAEILLEA